MSRRPKKAGSPTPRSCRPAPGVSAEQWSPDADDPGGVGARCRPCRGTARPGVVAQGVAEQLEARAGLGDDDGLVELQALADEGQQPGEEVVVPAVEEGLVLEPDGAVQTWSCRRPRESTGATSSRARSCHIRWNSGEASRTSTTTERSRRSRAHRARARQAATSTKSTRLRSRTAPPWPTGRGGEHLRVSRSALKVSTLPASDEAVLVEEDPERRHAVGAMHERVDGGDVGQRLAGELPAVDAHRRVAGALGDVVVGEVLPPHQIGPGRRVGRQRR